MESLNTSNQFYTLIAEFYKAKEFYSFLQEQKYNLFELDYGNKY